MLPAHGYPKLKQFKHLAGNYGGAWQEQKKELFEKTPLVDAFIEEKCKKCKGSGSLECDLGHQHDCEICDGGGIEKTPIGKKIINENELFLFIGSVFTQKQLMRLVTACEVIGTDKIYKMSGEGFGEFCFKIHEITILIMSCYFNRNTINDYQKIELK